MAVKLKGVSDVDGRTVEVTAKELRSSEDQNPSLLIKYNYSSTANPPPNSSQVRTDTDVALDTTKIWVHRTDNENRDVKYFLMHLMMGDKLYVQDIDNSDSHGIFKLVDDPVDEGAYVTLTVECDHASGVPLQGTAILVGLFS